MTLSLKYSRRTFCTAKSNPFDGHIFILAGHVRRVRRISRSLTYAWISTGLDNGQILIETATHSLGYLRI